MSEASTADMEKNLKLVYKIAWKFRGRLLMDPRLDMDDLVGWGVLGLGAALEKFDPIRGSQFSSYAWPYIWGYINNGLNLFDRQKHLARQRGAEVSEHSFSLYGEGEAPNVENYRDNEEQLSERLHGSQILERSWKHLTPRQQRVVTRKIQEEGVTNEEIARGEGISRERVRQIWQMSLSKMRKGLAA